MSAGKLPNFIVLKIKSPDQYFCKYSSKVILIEKIPFFFSKARFLST